MEASMKEINLALATLRMKHKQLLAQASKLAESIATIEETFEIGGQQEVMTIVIGPQEKPGPYAGMTIGDAAIQYLQGVGDFRKTREIVESLKTGGLESKSVNLYRTVYNSLLGREKDFELKDAKWGLKKWSQGRH